MNTLVSSLALSLVAASVSAQDKVPAPLPAADHSVRPFYPGDPSKGPGLVYQPTTADTAARDSRRPATIAGNRPTTASS